MTKDEIHNHIKSVAEYYVSESWNTFLDLDEIDLIMAGIGVGKIIADEQEKRIAELEEAKANLEYLLEGRDNEIDELKKENKNLAQNLEDTEICENGWKNRVRELEAQIEKMKCCGNCDWSNYLPNGNCLDCDGKKNWKLKEIKENDRSNIK